MRTFLCMYFVVLIFFCDGRLLPLMRVLPVRRHNRRGPNGPEVGDQNQWALPPNVKLTKREKRMMVATVMNIAVLVLFQTHVYEFVGKFFLQKKGGPIGLRPTCAIARIVMLWWDEQSHVASSNLTTEEKAR